MTDDTGPAEAYRIAITAGIDLLCAEAYRIAAEHGFHDEPRPLGTAIALMHSELSEALEADREGQPTYWEREDGKPEGIASEFADVLIRVADTCAEMGIDLGRAVAAKLAFNEGRAHKHGKAY